MFIYTIVFFSRSISDTKMTAFFQNNFTQDKWKKSAMKNAYLLMGKQRFKHAAAFFLLGGDLKVAVEVYIVFKIYIYIKSYLCWI